MRRIAFFILSFIVIFACGASALESTDVETTTTWNPYSPGPLNTWAAPILKAGELVLQPFFFYYRTRGIFNDEGSYKSYTNGAKTQQYVSDLMFFYGITDKLEVDGEFFYFETDKDLAPDVNANDGGFADSYAYVRYCLQEEKSWMPCITAIAQMKFPIGKYQKLDPGKFGADITGTGSYDQGYGVILTKKIKPLILHTDFIYNIPIQTTVDGVKTRYGNYINCDFAVEYILPKGFNLLLEVNYVQQGDLKLDGRLVPGSDTAALLIVPGIGWATEKVRALVCYQRTIAGTNAYVNDSCAATVQFIF